MEYYINNKVILHVEVVKAKLIYRCVFSVKIIYGDEQGQTFKTIIIIIFFN